MKILDHTNWLVATPPGFDLSTDHNNLIFLFNSLATMDYVSQSSICKVSWWAVNLYGPLQMPSFIIYRQFSGRYFDAPSVRPSVVQILSTSHISMTSTSGQATEMTRMFWCCVKTIWNTYGFSAFQIVTLKKPLIPSSTCVRSTVQKVARFPMGRRTSRTQQFVLWPKVRNPRTTLRVLNVLNATRPWSALAADCFVSCGLSSRSCESIGMNVRISSPSFNQSQPILMHHTVEISTYGLHGTRSDRSGRQNHLILHVMWVTITDEKLESKLNTENRIELRDDLHLRLLPAMIVVTKSRVQTSAAEYHVGWLYPSASLRLPCRNASLSPSTRNKLFPRASYLIRLPSWGSSRWPIGRHASFKT